MESIYKKARAKINLTLNILNKREDGYHNIESVFQKISLYDEIYVSKTEKHNDIKINTNISSIKTEDNIIFKAYENLKKEFKQIKGIDVFLKKNIPMQAGLGGGSSDCSIFIECINELFNLRLTLNQMKNIGVKLGADVPATFYNKPIIARAIGDEIEEINTSIKYYIVIIQPKFLCSTKEMFEKIDKIGVIFQKFNTTGMKNALEKNDIDEVSEKLYNVFENGIKNIEEIKKEIVEVGAIGSLMSGSGSCVYGIFKDKEKAKMGYKVLKEKYNTYFCISYVQR